MHTFEKDTVFEKIVTMKSTLHFCENNFQHLSLPLIKKRMYLLGPYKHG
jgi:hypothetical protein